MCGTETCERFVAGSVQPYCSTHYVTRHLDADDRLQDSFYVFLGSVRQSGVGCF